MRIWRRSIVPVAVACLLVGAPGAFADEIPAGEVVVEPEVIPPPPPPLEDWYLRGFYLGIGGSYDWIDNGFDNILLDPDGSDLLALCFDQSWNIEARGGYRFNDWFALEALYAYNFGYDFAVERRQANNPPPTKFSLGDITTNTFHVNAKFIAPLGRFQPYVYGGIGLLNADLDVEVDTGDVVVDDNRSDTQFAGKIGGGFDVYLTPHIPVFVEGNYVLPTSDLSDFKPYGISFGLKYIF